MSYSKMEWTELKGQTIKSVFYTDETGHNGEYLEEKDIHYLPGGGILFELENNQWVFIENDIERNGLTAYKSDASFVENFKMINLKSDRIWSRISNKTLKNVTLYPGHYYVGKPGGTTSGKDIKKEIITTIGLVFQHGESLFISLAELTIDNKIEDSLFDLILYVKRKIGILHGLISEQE